MTSYLPILIDLKNKDVFLFGGGRVALQKARALSERGAKVVAISREFDSEFAKFAKSRGIQMRRGAKLPRDLRRASLVVSATSDQRLNEKIARSCHKRHVPVNVADKPELCSFIFPSILKRGRLQVAVSTGGASPTIARLLRQKIERIIPRGISKELDELFIQRKRAQKSILDLQNRLRILKKSATLRFDVLSNNGNRNRK